MAERQPQTTTDNSSLQTHGERWAIVIGISKYQHESWNLQFADRDAEDVYRMIRSRSGGAFDDDHILFLQNEQANITNIRGALGGFLQKPSRDDLVFIYLACHGISDPLRPNVLYLMAHDTDPGDVASTALPMSDVDRALRDNLNAEKVVIVADTCHSAGLGGAIGGRRGSGDSSAQMNEYMSQLSAAKPSLALLTSAEANESSFENEKWGGGHGVFTHYLLKGMSGEADNGRDGIVDVGELFEYVRTNVINSTNHQQHPCIGNNAFDRHLPITLPGVMKAAALHDEARERFAAGDYRQAKELWNQALDQDADHAGAKQGLANIRTQREQRERRRAKLLRLKQTHELQTDEFTRCWTLLDKDRSELDTSEHDLLEMVEELADGKIDVSIFLAAARLIQKSDAATTDEHAVAPQRADPDRTVAPAPTPRPAESVAAPAVPPPAPATQPAATPNSSRRFGLYGLTAFATIAAAAVIFYLFVDRADQPATATVSPLPTAPAATQSAAPDARTVQPEPQIVGPVAEPEPQMNEPDTPTPPPVPTHSLTINPVPAFARVKILNIGPVYTSGMMLDAGEYLIEVTANDFLPDRRTIALTRDMTITVRLEPEPQPAPAPAPVVVAATPIQDWPVPAVGSLSNLTPDAEENTNYNYGKVYLNGIARPQDFARAAQYFHAAALGGHRGAQEELSKLYQSGNGVPPNATKAEQWWQNATYSDTPKRRSFKNLIPGMRD